MGARELPFRLVAILDDVVARLEDCGFPVSARTIEPGEPAWSYCCDDGHAYIRVVRMHQVNPFPYQTLDVTPCPNHGALLAVGVLRCGPTLDMEGNAPDPDEVTSTGLQVAVDAGIVRETLAEHHPDHANYPLVVDTWSPLGPLGGCYGGEWTFWADIDLCCPSTSPGTSPGSPGSP